MNLSNFVLNYINEELTDEQKQFHRDVVFGKRSLDDNKLSPSDIKKLVDNHTKSKHQSNTSDSQSKHQSNTLLQRIRNNPNKKSAAIGAGTAAVAGGLGYLAHRAGKKSALDRAKGFVKKHPYGTAGASLAALGAGVGTAALLRYLRKKKKQG